MRFDGPGTEICHPAHSTALLYLEGSFGGLVMGLLFLSAILVATSRMWGIGAKRIAVTEIVLVLALIACGVNTLRHSPGDYISALLCIAFIVSAVVIPIYAATLCWLKGFRRTALTVTALVILGLGLFAVRTFIPLLVSNPYETCEEGNGSCVCRTRGPMQY